MLTLMTALVSCSPEALDPATDPGRVVFLCRDDSLDTSLTAPELHVACSGDLSDHVLRTVLAGDRILVAGTAQLLPSTWATTSRPAASRSSPLTCSC